MSQLFQQLLDALGAVLAFLYDLVPNYGIAIILFTLGIRLLLLPLGIKQVRVDAGHAGLAAEDEAAPAEVQGRPRSDERGADGPVPGARGEPAQRVPAAPGTAAGAVRAVRGAAVPDRDDAHPAQRHRPDRLASTGQRAYVAIHEDRTFFLGANLLCSATQAGKQVSQAQVTQNQVPDAPPVLDCGTGWPSRIPYYVLALAMIGSTFYQQRQMQRASPGGTRSSRC